MNAMRWLLVFGSLALCAVALVANDAPTMDPLPLLTYPESTLNAALSTLHVTGIGPGSSATAGQVLTVQASTANSALAVVQSIVFDAASGTAAIRLRPITYANGSTLIYVSVRDESGGITVRTGTVTVTPMPDRPQLALNSDFVAPGQSVVLTTTDIHVYDPDDPPPATLILTLLQAPTQGEFLFGGTQGIGAGGTFTYADVLAGRISYHHLIPVSGSIQSVEELHLQVFDGTYSAIFPSFTFIYITQNIQPVIHMGQPTATWNEGGGPVAICSSSSVLSLTLAGLTLSVSILAPEATADDVLAIQKAGTGAGQIWVDGPTVSYQGVEIATWSGGRDGAPLILQFSNSGAQLTAVEALLRSIVYDNTGRGPGAAQRTIQAQLSSLYHGLSDPVTTTIALHLVDDPPQIATTWIGTLAGVSRVMNLAVHDPDSTAFTWSVLAQPTLARVDLLDAASGRIALVPLPGLSGSDTVVVSVSDGVNPPVVAELIVRVSSFDDPRPQALADAPFTARAGEVMSADIPWDADVTVAVEGDVPSGLTVTALSARAVRLTWAVPSSTAVGLHAFALIADDGAAHATGRLPVLLAVSALPGAAQ